MEFRTNNIPRRMSEPLAQLGASTSRDGAMAMAKIELKWRDNDKLTALGSQISPENHFDMRLTSQRLSSSSIRCPVTPSILTAVFLVARRQR